VGILFKEAGLEYPVVIVQPDVFRAGLYYVKEKIFFDFDEFSVTIPKGFSTDGASIPLLFWTVLGLNPYSPRLLTAAVVHDALFTDVLFANQHLPDLAMNRIMKDHGLGLFRRSLIIAGLKLFGWYVFHFGKRSILGLDRLKAQSESAFDLEAKRLQDIRVQIK